MNNYINFGLLPIIRNKINEFVELEDFLAKKSSNEEKILKNIDLMLEDLESERNLLLYNPLNLMMDNVNVQHYYEKGQVWYKDDLITIKQKVIEQDDQLIGSRLALEKGFLFFNCVDYYQNIWFLHPTFYFRQGVFDRLNHSNALFSKIFNDPFLHEYYDDLVDMCIINTLNEEYKLLDTTHCEELFNSLSIENDINFDNDESFKNYKVFIELLEKGKSKEFDLVIIYHL